MMVIVPIEDGALINRWISHDKQSNRWISQDWTEYRLNENRQISRLIDQKMINGLILLVRRTYRSEDDQWINSIGRENRQINR